MGPFDKLVRDDESPGLYAEPAYTFLNRSAWLECERIRRTLEEWFSRYPAAGRQDLLGRFRSPHNIQHHRAFFELLLHELLLRLQCHVEIHPTLGNGAAVRPDFRVESPTDSSFYLEAAAVSGESDEEAAARARMNVVYDALNPQLDSPNFFIWMNLRGAPKTSPPARHMKAFLERRLEPLDPDEIDELFKSDGLNALPHWPHEHAGWQIEFVPFPKSPPARGKLGIRPVASRSEVRSVDWPAAIRDRIIEKARRHRGVSLPYIVAVSMLGALDETADCFDVIPALFGREQFRVVVTDSGPGELERIRGPDGVWTSRRHPRYRGLSGVLVARRVDPWNLPRGSLRLYHNPWARRPCTFGLTRLPQAFLRGLI